MNTLRLLSYNIHKGKSLEQAFVLDHIKQALQTFNADFVFLQEVVGLDRDLSQKTAGTTASQLEYLADSVWPHYAYGQNSLLSEGHHGNALLSRFPIKSIRQLNLSTNRLEQRSLLHGIVEIPGQTNPLHLLCVHLSLFESGRRQQVNRLIAEINQIPQDHPVILAGDFNDWRRNLSRPLFEAGFKEVFQELHHHHARTFPSWLPLLTLDRIYYRGVVPTTADCLSGPSWRRLSDHLALYAEINLPTSK